VKDIYNEEDYMSVDNNESNVSLLQYYAGESTAPENVTQTQTTINRERNLKINAELVGAGEELSPESQLFNAINSYDSETINDVINQFTNIDVNIQGKFRNTALHVAVINNDANLVKSLLKKRADISLVNDKGETVLHIAAYYGLIEIVSILMEYVKESKSLGGYSEHLLNKYNGWGKTPLMEAVEKNNVEIVKILLSSHYININLQREISKIKCVYYTPKSASAPETAVIQGHESIVELLLQYDQLNYSVRGGLITYIKNNSATQIEIYLQGSSSHILHLAAASGQLNILKLLLKKIGINSITISDNHNNNILHAAIEEAQIEVITFLLNKQSLENTLGEEISKEIYNNFINQQNYGSVTPLGIFLSKLDIYSNPAFKQVLYTLIASPFLNPNIYYSFEGDNILHFACASDENEIIQMLSKRSDVDFNLKNAKGETPLHVTNSPKTLNLLRELANYRNDIDVNSYDEFEHIKSLLAISFEELWFGESVVITGLTTDKLLQVYQTKETFHTTIKYLKTIVEIECKIAQKIDTKYALKLENNIMHCVDYYFNVCNQQLKSEKEIDEEDLRIRQQLYDQVFNSIPGGLFLDAGTEKLIIDDINITIIKKSERNEKVEENAEVTYEFLASMLEDEFSEGVQPKKYPLLHKYIKSSEPDMITALANFSKLDLEHRDEEKLRAISLAKAKMRTALNKEERRKLQHLENDITVNLRRRSILGLKQRLEKYSTHDLKMLLNLAENKILDKSILEGYINFTVHIQIKGKNKKSKAITPENVLKIINDIVCSRGEEKDDIPPILNRKEVINYVILKAAHAIYDNSNRTSGEELDSETEQNQENIRKEKWQRELELTTVNKESEPSSIFIPVFRGINFMRDLFEYEDRNTYEQQAYSKPFFASHACYFMLDKEPHDQTVTLEQLTEQADRIQNLIRTLNDPDTIKLFKGSEKALRNCKSLLRRLQLLYTENIDGFNYDIFTNISGASPEIKERILNQFPWFNKIFTKNPFVSGSITPMHSVRYALGVSRANANTELLLDPRYNSNGKPKYPCVGLVFIALYPMEEYQNLEAINVPKAFAHGEFPTMKSQLELLAEAEITIAGMMKYVVVGMPIVFPNFENNCKKGPLEEYISSRKNYMNIVSGIKKKRGSIEYREAIGKLKDHLITFYDKKLIQIAKNRAKLQEGELNFELPDSSFTEHTPEPSKIQSIAKNKRLELEKSAMKKMEDKLENEKAIGILFSQGVNAAAMDDNHRGFSLLTQGHDNKKKIDKLSLCQKTVNKSKTENSQQSKVKVGKCAFFQESKAVDANAVSTSTSRLIRRISRA
jgi:ankyrin repeat protein